jgi:hypothetical protein
MVGMVFAFTAAYFIFIPGPIVPEPYTPAKIQADGSLIVEKKPDATAKPAAMIPKGATVERIVKVTVQGGTPISKFSGTVEVTEQTITKSDNAAMLKEVAAPELVCPPVDIEVAFVRNKDDTRSVIVSSPNGTVLSAVDIPVELAKPTPKPLLWSAGAVVNPFKSTYGAYIDRDIGWFRVGAQINQASETRGMETWLKAGIRF